MPYRSNASAQTVPANKPRECNLSDDAIRRAINEVKLQYVLGEEAIFTIEEYAAPLGKELLSERHYVWGGEDLERLALRIANAWTDWGRHRIMRAAFSKRIPDWVKLP